MSKFCYPKIKRVFDLFFSIVGLICLSPVMATIALLVKMKLGSPIFFRQLRPGFYSRPFIIFKFRTMTDNVDEYGSLLPDGKRLTPFGNLLRSTSLDELPELLNIIKGEMSFVGPRPLLTKYLDRYSQEQVRRHEVKPGITGWAQVNGRNAITWEDKFELDVWYVDNQSFNIDLKILAMTIWKIIKREGINQQGHVTAEEFNPQTTRIKAD